WTVDGASLVFSANRRDDWEHEPLDSELHRLSIADGAITKLTDRRGTDSNPVVSPDGKQIAYLGFDDIGRSYHQPDLYFMSIDGRDRRCLTADFDRDVANPRFSGDGRSVYFQYDDEGDTKVGVVSLATGTVKPSTVKPSTVKPVVAGIGGVNFGRPYA